jgi:hypothetical protein
MTLGGDQYLHSPGHKEGISLGEVVHAAQADLLSSSACVTPAHKNILHFGGAHVFKILSHGLNNVAPMKRLSYPDFAEYCPLLDNLQ